MLLATILLTAFLLALNAFFALAEFAVVRVRPTRVAELAHLGSRRALALARIQADIDEYLSVVQVGITCAGVGLGLVLDQGLAKAIGAALPGEGLVSRVVGLGIALLAGTYFSVVLGELVPKALAMRDSERLALLCALPLRLFHRLFWLPLKVLAGSARLVLRLLGYGELPTDSPHSEYEMRTMLGASQRGGMMSFRRLLMVENVLDLGELRVRDAMRPREHAQLLTTEYDEDRVLAVVREHRFSRYPLVDPVQPGSALPLGIVHVKDLLARDRSQPLDLRAIARNYLTFTEEAALEDVLAEFQKSHRHLAIVKGAQGAWSGILAMEDVLEDIVGQIHDEFERETLELTDVVRVSRILVDVQVGSFEELVRRMAATVGDEDLPAGFGREQLARVVLDRELSLTTYVGRGVMLPHARVPGLRRPLVVFARLRQELPVPGHPDAARMAFLLLAPAAEQRVHLRLLSRIANVVDSEYVMARLSEAATPEAVVEAMTAGSRVASS